MKTCHLPSCLLCLSFNLKIKAVHDKYWREVIFTWLQTMPSTPRVGVSMYPLIHCSVLMTNEKNLCEVSRVGCQSMSSLWDLPFSFLCYNVIHNPPKWLYRAQGPEGPILFLSVSAWSFDAEICAWGDKLVYVQAGPGCTTVCWRNFALKNLGPNATIYPPVVFFFFF